MQRALSKQRELESSRNPQVGRRRAEAALWRAAKAEGVHYSCPLAGVDAGAPGGSIRVNS